MPESVEQANDAIMLLHSVANMWRQLRDALDKNPVNPRTFHAELEQRDILECCVLAEEKKAAYPAGG